MTIYNVIQIGSQREGLVGIVDATDTDDAQMKAYAEYGDDGDRDRGYDSFRVEPEITFTKADTKDEKEIEMTKYESFKIGDIVTLTDEGFAALEIAEWSGKTPLLLGKDYVYNSSAFILSSFAEEPEADVQLDVAELSVDLGQRDAEIKRLEAVIDSRDAEIKGLKDTASAQIIKIEVLRLAHNADVEEVEVSQRNLKRLQDDIAKAMRHLRKNTNNY